MNCALPPDYPTGSSVQWVDFAGESLCLLPEKGVWWPKNQTLFLADIHIGKARSFHRIGLPVPDTSNQDLMKIQALLEALNARHLVILGDLLHADHSNDQSFFDQFGHFLEAIRLESCLLISGNHDPHGGALAQLESSRFSRHPEGYGMGPFTLCHFPDKNASKDKGDFRLCGHLHPGCRVPVKHGKPLRAPCFVLSPHQLIVPAYGSLTGLFMVSPDRESSQFPVIGNSVIRIA